MFALRGPTDPNDAPAAIRDDRGGQLPHAKASCDDVAAIENHGERQAVARYLLAGRSFVLVLGNTDHEHVRTLGVQRLSCRQRLLTRSAILREELYDDHAA